MGIQQKLAQQKFSTVVPAGWGSTRASAWAFERKTTFACAAAQSTLVTLHSDTRHIWFCVGCLQAEKAQELLFLSMEPENIT